MAYAVSQVLEDLRWGSQLNAEHLGPILGVLPATVELWEAGAGTPDPRTEIVLAQLRYVMDRLNDFFTAEETRLWLYYALIAGEERPIGLIAAGRTEAVLAAIAAFAPRADP